eukprot:8540031-Pyramimonas_sp.AAC.1
MQGYPWEGCPSSLCGLTVYPLVIEWASGRHLTTKEEGNAPDDGSKKAPRAQWDLGVRKSTCVH